MKAKSSRSKKIDKLDRVFSEFIRKRDSKDGVFKCISCGKIKPYAQADAGHYFSRRHLSTRFDEDNVHAECSYCNRFNAEHLEYYRVNLIKKIGENAFNMLKIRSTMQSKLSEFEIEVLIKHYKERIKEL